MRCNVLAKVLQEAECLQDTAIEIRLVPRQPTGREFIPVGHFALDIHDAGQDAKLGLPPRTVWVHQLFISRALQGGGYGVATMAKVEATAAQEPMNATWMALDTLAKEVQKEADDRVPVVSDFIQDLMTIIKLKYI
jgi:GNAT superfamily N-acetyltransferase